MLPVPTRGSVPRSLGGLALSLLLGMVPLVPSRGAIARVIVGDVIPRPAGGDRGRRLLPCSVT